MLTAQSQKLASKKFFQIAQTTEKEMGEEQEPEKKTALRMVSGQNYFYAGIEAVESILREAGTAVEDHRDRIQKVQQNYRLFKNPDDILTKHKILTEEGLNYRRRVAYRGENGKKFITLKEFGELAQKEIENEAA